MNELTYTMNGDYLIPDIRLKETETRTLGKYGRLRRAYLQEHRPILFNNLLLSENLFPHLWETQEAALRRLEQITQELLKKNPAPNKQTHQMEWVQHMNSLKAQAEEVIMSELIYS